MYLSQKKIGISTSSIENIGYGIFAEEDIYKDEIICECPLLTIDKGIYDYHFSFEGKLYIALGFGSLFNHSENPNAIYKYENNLLKFTSIKEIKIGEEIFYDYGIQYNRKYFNK